MKKFGVFKLSSSNVNSLSIRASTPYNMEDVKIKIANDLLFDSEADAELKIQELQGPALYIILPCYLKY